MPLVAGPWLRQELTRRGKLPLGEAVDLLAQVADALAAAHADGIIHRDVRPENMLLDTSGPTRRALLADFGIAASRDGPHLTTGNAVVGTAEYLAPERVRGEPATTASDLYALGIILFELLTGRPPFQGEHPLETATAHLTRPLPNLSTLLPGAPAGLLHLLEALLARDPAQRPSNAAAVAQALRQIEDASQQTTHALTPARITHPLRPAPAERRRWLLFPLALLALLLLATLAGGATLQRGAGNLGLEHALSRRWLACPQPRREPCWKMQALRPLSATKDTTAWRQGT